MRTHEIGIDLPCVICGYNLRTRELRGRCPECGAPVGKAIAAWPMRGRRHAARFIRGTAAIALLNTLLLLSFLFMLWHITADKRRLWFDRHPGESLFIFFSAYATAMALAAWHATAIALTGQLSRTGRWIRGSSICFACAHLVPLLMIYTIAFEAAPIVFWYIFLPAAWVLVYQLGAYFEEVCWACDFPRLGRLSVETARVLAITLACGQILALPAVGLPAASIWHVLFALCLAVSFCALLIWTATQFAIVLCLRIWVV